MGAKFTIRLEKLRFFSRIGVFEQERKVGNEFIVDVTVVADAATFVDECLETSLSYADIFAVVSDMMGREWKLLESVAKSIAGILREKWQTISQVSVKITKLAVPITGIQGVCSVEYSD